MVSGKGGVNFTYQRWKHLIQENKRGWVTSFRARWRNFTPTIVLRFLFKPVCFFDKAGLQAQIFVEFIFVIQPWNFTISWQSWQRKCLILKKFEIPRNSASLSSLLLYLNTKCTCWNFYSSDLVWMGHFHDCSGIQFNFQPRLNFRRTHEFN